MKPATSANWSKGETQRSLIGTLFGRPHRDATLDDVELLPSQPEEQELQSLPAFVFSFGEGSDPLQEGRLSWLRPCRESSTCDTDGQVHSMLRAYMIMEEEPGWFEMNNYPA
ncbi:hypothetical protein D8B26_003765 [Coccidioides posadasii str. Silveira]|uniref:uncharacterized protein n=1 Tax=Coccidioides posadasii (strain RMSCC 757 / Silveira) TaxID=443226 RepID=UPI001BEF0D5B|nr:hypothetical protein D8B26_003765 [Coccidioides posadasii str. Silveira]